MSDLIPSCPWEQFKAIVDSGKVEELQSCEVKVGEVIFTAIIPKGDMFTKEPVRVQAERLGLRSNMPGGKPPADLLSEPYGRAVLKAKREAERVSA
jgi:hypothetical protein